MKAYVLLILSGLLFFVSCSENPEDDNLPTCPLDAVTFGSPYSDPVWHPSGEFIGFNYTPLKRITYTYGYDCPHHADYEVDYENRGFYLVDADGSNQRMVLPFKLGTPAWSPDGEWMAFHAGGTIYKMQFDGEEFDTANIVQLTFEGSNFYPSWSPDGEWIAYDNTTCGNSNRNPPPNSCGVLIMQSDGSERYYLRGGRIPAWSRDADYLVFGGSFNDQGALIAFNFKDSIYNAIAWTPEDVTYASQIKFSWDGSYLGNILRLSKHERFKGVTLYKLNLTRDSSFEQIAPIGIETFDWGPNNQIVYQNFDHSRIDEEQGTLWVMNEGGTGQRQLTFHNGLEIIIP